MPRWAFACYVMLALLGLAARSDRVNLNGDGAQYASEAENLGRGRGLVTSLPYYDEHHRLGPLPVSQTVFPPGYPAVVACVLALGIPVDRACLLVAMLGQVASVLALYLVAKEAGHSRGACLLVSATWACFVVNWLNVLHCSSESTFIPLTLWGAWCVVRFRSTGRRRWAVLAGVLAGCAFSVRYFGVFFIAAIVAREAIHAARARRREACADLAALVLGPAVAILLIFGRNYAIVGDYRGGNSTATHRALATILVHFGHWCLALLGFDRTGLRASSTMALILFAWCAGGLSWIAANLRRVDLRATVAALGPRRDAWLLPLTYGLIACCGLVALQKGSPTSLDGRMLSPLIPFALLGLLEGVSRVRWVGPTRANPSGRPWVAAGFALFLLGQRAYFLDATRSIARADADARTIRAALSDPIAGEMVGDFLRARCSEWHPVLTGDCQLLGPILGRPAVGLSPDFYTRQDWDDLRVERLVGHFRVRYVVAFPTMLARSGQGPTPRRDAFFVRICEGRVPPWLREVHAGPGVKLFRVESAHPPGPSPDPVTRL